jgi:uncharacterized protein (DUF2235 family)
MARRIAIFLDGTCDTYFQPAKNNSNVGRMWEATREEDDGSQLRYYKEGVGTQGDLLGAATGRGLDERIIAAYRYLMQNYSDGTELFIFGFSRGAYEARSLAGMLGRVGLVKKGEPVTAENAYDFYKIAPDHPDQVAAFAEAHCIFPRVKMIGVWDTVGALGLPVPTTHIMLFAPKFHDTDLGAHIDHAYHAIAIDEQRYDFAPTYWNPASVRPGQTLEQVYFAGVHSDIGGGYDDDRSLANITLAWMMRRAQANGLELYPDKIVEMNDVDAFGTLHDSFAPAYEPRGRFYRVIDQGTMPIHITARQRIECAADGCKPFPYKPEINMKLGQIDKYKWVSDQA